MTRLPLAAAHIVGLAAVLAGCTYDEGITVENMTGTVVLPREAATRTVIGADGTETELTDVRFIGPVYLGLYPAVEEGLLEYPHPEIGPSFQQGIAGDTYPYGGTTIGDLRFACMEHLSCRVVSGRYVDFDTMMTWFDDVLGMPIPDESGDPITTGDYIRQTCFEMLNYTSDEELRLTATDRNGDGEVDTKDLDFVENDDGDFEATFTMWQQEWFESDDGQGFTLWGWMDSPSTNGFRFSTCNTQDGFQQQEYDDDFWSGTQHMDLLNHPSQYISVGDWVSNEPHTYQQIDDEVVLRLGHEVTQ